MTLSAERRARTDYLAFGKPSFTAAETAAVTRVLESGWVGMGPETIAFEAELRQFLGVENVVTVNSCTSALFLSLRVSGVGTGDEVICPSLTWCSTANAALYLGARPVFCDVSPDTLCATAATIEAKITARTKAVIVVHFGGLAAEVDAIREMLPPSICLIEDAAHAFGATYADGSLVGSKSNLTCFSFYANKNLSTGEGGAIALNDGGIAKRLRSIRYLGLNADSWSRFKEPAARVSVSPGELGYKMNFTDLQAAIGRVQLSRYAAMQAVRSGIADHYSEALAGQGPGVQTQTGITGPGHAKHLFLLKLPIERMTKNRDQVVKELRAENVGASIHYPPLHQMPLYGAEASPLPDTEHVGERLLTLPISASMTLDDAEYVVEKFWQVLSP